MFSSRLAAFFRFELICLPALPLVLGCGGAGGDKPANVGGSGGAPARAFQCPAGPYEAPKLAGLTPLRVEGVPPADAFNDDNNAFSNIEGDVWVGDALYVSEIVAGAGPPPARILKVDAEDRVSVVMADSGSNGLAVDASGQLFGALHKDGSISRLDLLAGSATPVVGTFDGARFNSPNDLAIHSSGTIYFSDPDYQAPAKRPQAATRAYRVPAGGQAVEIETLRQPNGVTLSKSEDFLYISGGQLKRYPVLSDGSLGPGVVFKEGATGDGMVIDCADNLYVAAGAAGVKVYDPTGAELGTIAVSGLGDVTNVAFGGADHQTLYISGQGGKNAKGLFRVRLNLAGYPY